MKSVKYALLASSVLSTVGSGASAATFTEGAGSGFPDSPPGSSIDFGTFQTVEGTLTSGSDPADYFTFTSLTAGADFSITFTRGSDGCGSCASFVFTADGFSETLAPGTSEIDFGVLGTTSLTVGVTNPAIGGSSSFAEGYSVTLSEIPAGIPGPPAAVVFAVGLAGLAVARRKRRRR
jgi:hypothetical protein